MLPTSDTGWDEFLRAAVAEGDVELMRQALGQGADPNVQTPDADCLVLNLNSSPLFLAVSGGRAEAVKLLLEAGASVAGERDADQTSLHAAVENNGLTMVELLLGADGREALDWFDYVDRTPLMIAVENGNVEMARRLIAAGADVNAHNEKRAGDTALGVAATKNSLEMVTLLVRAGADPMTPSGMGLTPLHKARQRRRLAGPQIREFLEGIAQERQGKQG